MGLTAAAIATSHLILQFRPRLVVMVGIAAGTRSGNKQYGDVLVADPSVDYNSGVAEVSGSKEGGYTLTARGITVASDLTKGINRREEGGLS